MPIMQSGAFNLTVKPFDSVIGTNHLILIIMNESFDEIKNEAIDALEQACNAYFDLKEDLAGEKLREAKAIIARLEDRLLKYSL